MQPQRKKSHGLNWIVLMRNGAGNIPKSQNQCAATIRIDALVLALVYIDSAKAVFNHIADDPVRGKELRCRRNEIGRASCRERVSSPV